MHIQISAGIILCAHGVKVQLAEPLSKCCLMVLFNKKNCLLISIRKPFIRMINEKFPK